MDRSWIRKSKPGDMEYEVGVRQFINFSVKNSKGRERLPCPCHKCHNLLHNRVDEILNHLSKSAFDNTYTCWIWHGEKKNETYVGDHETSGHEKHDMDEGEKLEDLLRVAQDKILEDPNTVEKLVNDSEEPLYSNCTKYSRLKAVVRMYNLKANYGWSDKSFSDLLELVKDLLPEDNVLPKGTYEAKKILSSMGLRYEKIHACPNDCILCRKEHESLNNCPVCNASRYKKAEVPAKVLWYFPIIPRLRRLFSDVGDAKRLTWHYDGRKKDGKLRHPADSPQWRFIDGLFSDFGAEERNLRLALSTDGMNSFSSLSSIYSTWPVILVTYNLPPSLCMKRKYMMLSLLISRPKQPGNNIDVYLAPLIDDLILLWEQGVEVWDAYQNELFNLKALLFCTIQDFPAYGNLSGYIVKGEATCPVCEDGLKGKWLKASKKMVFTDNRQFLPSDHPYRKRKKAFNGEQEFKARPRIKTSAETFENVKDIHTIFGKGNNLPSLHKDTKNVLNYGACLIGDTCL